MAESDRAVIKGDKLERAAYLLNDYACLLAETCGDDCKDLIEDARTLAAIFRDATRHKVVLSG